MTKLTIQDVSTIIPVEQTPSVVEAVEAYLNEGTIPPYDPCQNCEPNHIRKLISLLQVAERNGLVKTDRSITHEDTPDLAEDSYTAGIMSREEADYIKAERTEAEIEAEFDWSDARDADELEADKLDE